MTDRLNIESARDAELIEALRITLDTLTGADHTRAAVIVQRANSLRRPLMAGWQAEAREIMQRRRAETEQLARALGFESNR